jgi:putative FmdB family regulatory protein
MPLYEYECFVCRQRFERIQKVSADPVAACPACGGSVRRLLGSPALQFKGSGWYVTDYAKSSSVPSGRGEGSATSTEAKDAGAAAASDKPSTSDAGKASGSSTPTPSST